MKWLKEFLKKRSELNPKAIITLAIVVIFLFGIYGTQAAIDYTYKNKILPGVTIGDRSFGRLTLKEARTKLQKSVDTIQEQGATFCHNEKCIEINASFTALNDPDLSYDLFSVDIDKAIDSAYAVGRTGSLVTRISDQWKLSRHQQTILLNWQIDTDQIKKYLQINFSDYENPAKNTTLSISLSSTKPSISFGDSSEGLVIDYEKALTETNRQLTLLQTPFTTLEIKTDYPTITTVDKDAIEKDVLRLMNVNNWTFSYEDHTWTLSKNEIAKALSIESIPDSSSVLFNTETFQELLSDTKKSLEEKPLDAKFELEEGRVVEFQPSQEGIEILVAASLENANLILKNNTSTAVTFPLSIAITPSETPNAAVNDLGITELLASGRSDFSGSPANRRHNIAIGSASLNGLLIAPGEEFSLVAALGDIDGTTGYKEELVIKGNETIPEFGGGLCQVGTTIFRATLNSGLPITERQNHSYRVSYYEPAGTDATIYGPHPDYRFVNDTGNHILIQTHIEGDILVYELWGTNDGRIATQTTPVIYNITSPPPTKYIETLDLPVGKINCTERAHKGADASFDYSVAYPDGEIKDVTFKSHYRAWQEVCLIGVEKLSEPEATPEAELDEVQNSLN